MEVVTYGCALNRADGEILAGLLREAGLGEAHVIVVNTCTVKSPTETKILRKLRELEAAGEKVVVAGCIPAARPGIAEEFPTFSFIGTNVEAAAEAVRRAAAGGRHVDISGAGDKSSLPQDRGNPAVGIVPIAEGCLGACAYCQTKNARGSLRSGKPKDIVRRAEGFAAAGAREIWLTAQDTGAYGLDIGTDLPELLAAVSSAEGDFKVRVGMMNPDHAARMLDRLVEAYAHERVYKFLHLPVQSGDDRVLADMGRRYTAEEFKDVARAFRPLKATLSTDVILGYPTEGVDAFKNTVRLVEEVKPDVLNSTRYWPRPGTPAARLKQLPGKETKRRSRIIGEVFARCGLERNTAWVGWEGPCLVSEENPDGTYTARNAWYKPIVVKGKGLLGKTVSVEVRKATSYDLRGAVI
jgi:threonylcarbamoyladenosine tRNA methylthiotransferase CDKAL1